MLLLFLLHIHAVFVLRLNILFSLQAMHLFFHAYSIIHVAVSPCMQLICRGIRHIGCEDYIQVKDGQNVLCFGKNCPSLICKNVTLITNLESIGLTTFPNASNNRQNIRIAVVLQATGMVVGVTEEEDTAEDPAMGQLA